MVLIMRMGSRGLLRHSVLNSLFFAPLRRDYLLGNRRLGQTRNMHIQSIPMCEYRAVFLLLYHRPNYLPRIQGVGSSNNYAYLVTDEASKDAVIIDPANPPEYALLSVLSPFHAIR